jgi:hypothetical protein
MIHYFITLFIVSIISSHSINAHAFQEKDSTLHGQDHLIVAIQKELRTPEYRKEVLPHNFSHLSHLIAHGANSNQPPTYLRSIVKLFSNMLKGITLTHTLLQNSLKHYQHKQFLIFHSSNHALTSLIQHYMMQHLLTAFSQQLTICSMQNSAANMIHSDKTLIFS